MLRSSVNEGGRGEEEEEGVAKRRRETERATGRALATCVATSGVRAGQQSARRGERTAKKRFCQRVREIFSLRPATFLPYAAMLPIVGSALSARTPAMLLAPPSFASPVAAPSVAAPSSAPAPEAAIRAAAAEAYAALDDFVHESFLR